MTKKVQSQRMRSFKDQMGPGKHTIGLLEATQVLSRTDLSAPIIHPLSNLLFHHCVEQKDH